MVTHALYRRLSENRGFTLIEMLVAMLIAGVIMAALSMIFVTSLHQQSQASDKAQSDKLARILMTSIVEELHSGCTGLGAYSIKAPSSTSTLGAPESPLGEANSTNLWFVSAYDNSESAKAVIGKATLHDINWTKTATSKTNLALGTVTDYSFASNGGEAPNWTFPTLKVSNATARTLGTNVVVPTPAGTPLFQYYSIVNSSSSSSNGEISTTPLSTPLTGATETTEVTHGTAEETAKITISFMQAPTDGDTRSGHTSALTDSVVLRFTPTTTGTGITDSPCE